MKTSRLAGASVRIELDRRLPAALLILLVTLLAQSCADRTSGPVALNEGKEAESSVTKSDVDEYVQGEMQKRQIPGLALAVVRNGEIVMARGYGFARVELGIAVTPSTRFRLASITKQFTATALMLLVQEGKVGLDDSITEHLNEVPDSWAAVTLRHLLTHTSGLTDRLWYGSDEEASSAFEMPPDFEPGERWSYTDFGYVVLGLVIERVSGRPYGDYLADRLFDPLGMTSTVAGRPDYAIAYRLRQEKLRRSFWPPAEGGVISNLVDLAKWEAALLGEKILPQSSLEAMWTPVRLNDGSAYDYGFGWSLNDVRGHRIVGHGGGGSWGNYYLRLPDQQLAVIVLTNLAMRDGSSPRTIAQGVARRYAPDVWPRMSEKQERPDPDPEMTSRVKVLLQAIVRTDVEELSFVSPKLGAALRNPNRRKFLVPRWITEEQLSSLSFITCEDPEDFTVERAQIQRVCHYKLAHPVETRFFSVSLTSENTIAVLQSTTE